MVASTNNFDWTIENNIEFERKLDRLGAATNDFRIPFRLISSDFYRSQKQIFQLKSAGLYNPLGGFNFNQPSGFGSQSKRERAEDLKERKTGHAWAPILYGVTGDLKDSTLSKNHRNSIFFLSKKEMNIGTNIPYGKYHQSDKQRSIIPQRKFIFIDGGEKDTAKGSRISGRRERWISIIDTHVEQLLTGRI